VAGAISRSGKFGAFAYKFDRLHLGQTRQPVEHTQRRGTGERADAVCGFTRLPEPAQPGPWAVNDDVLTTVMWFKENWFHLTETQMAELAVWSIALDRPKVRGGWFVATHQG